MKDNIFYSAALVGAAASATPVFAQTDYSAMIAANGLAATATATKLEQNTALSADDRFALGAVHFLRGVERAYQTRWQVGLTDGRMSLPMLQGVLPPNPDPAPFQAGTLRTLFTDVLADMARAEAALAGVSSDDAPVLLLALPDLWFDINMDGKRGATEGFADVMAQAVMRPWELRKMKEALAKAPGAPNPLEQSIRFDTADVSWLHAYTQAISGISEVVLAFDPTVEIARVLETRAAFAAQADSLFALSPEGKSKSMASLRDRHPDKTEAELEQILEKELKNERGSRHYYSQETLWVDTASVVIETLRHQPDVKRIAAAQGHFLRMAELNYRFWQALALETDNDMEWIPNPSQQAVLGFELPEGTGEAWIAVLQDAEAVLKGEKLIPFWRFATGHGVDLAAYVANPTPLPVVEWIQGSAALPFAKQGAVMDASAWRRFRRLMGGRAGLFAILLN